MAKADKNPSPASTAVAETAKSSTELATADTMNFEEDAGKGMEGADKDSFAIPFLSILQGLSPQMDPDSGIPGAKLGMIVNTVTNELYSTLKVVPVAFQRR